MEQLYIIPHRKHGLRSRARRLRFQLTGSYYEYIYIYIYICIYIYIYTYIHIKELMAMKRREEILDSLADPLAGRPQQVSEALKVGFGGLLVESGRRV